MIDGLVGREFRRDSIVLIWGDEPYGKFVEEGSIRLNERDAYADSDNELDDVPEGVCLVSEGDYVNDVFSVPPMDGEDARPRVDALLRNLWLSECRDGRLTRSTQHALQTILLSARRDLHHSIRELPMNELERATCKVGQIQNPGAYRIIFDTGNFSGIMNRGLCGRCHGECTGLDLVRIESDLCLFRARLRGEFEWVQLFPFRLNRCGEPGRLLTAFRHGIRWFPVQRSGRSGETYDRLESWAVSLPFTSWLWGTKYEWYLPESRLLHE